MEHQCISWADRDKHNTIVLKFVVHTECGLVNCLYNQLILEAHPSSLSLHYITEMRYTNSQMNSSAVTKYSVELLRQIRWKALTDYKNFHVNSTIRSHIISLGIRKQPLLHKYHQTRAGRQLLYKINTIAFRVAPQWQEILCTTNRKEVWEGTNKPNHSHQYFNPV